MYVCMCMYVWMYVCMYVCVWTICTDVKLLSGTSVLFVMVHDFLISFSCRGTQHFTGTVSNEATSEMGYPAWPAGRTCINFSFL